MQADFRFAWLLRFPQLGKHLRFDVASRNDGEVQLCVWEFFGVEDESGGGDCAAGLGYGLRIGGHVFHGLTDFVFGYGDDVVDVGTDVLEVEGADALGAESVGERTRDLFGRELDDFALAQTRLRIGSEFGLDTDDLYFRIRQLDGGCYAGDEASAADGGENGFDVGEFIEDFEAYGALSGDDVFVVVGRDDDVSVVPCEPFGFVFALVGARAYEDDFCTEICGGFALDLRCVVGHDDDRFRLERAGGVGDALGVVAAGVGDDTFLSFRV